MIVTYEGPYGGTASLESEKLVISIETGQIMVLMPKGKARPADDVEVSAILEQMPGVKALKEALTPPSIPVTPPPAEPGSTPMRRGRKPKAK